MTVGGPERKKCGTRRAGQAAMTGGTNNRFFSHMMVVGIMALAIAGCAAMLGAGEKSLFADLSYDAAYAEAAR
jgi:hypothetical protein